MKHLIDYKQTVEVLNMITITCYLADHLLSDIFLDKKWFFYFISLYFQGPVSRNIHLRPVWFLQHQLHRDHAGSFRCHGATPPDGARTGCRQSNDCWERCLFHDGLYCWTSIRIKVETAKTPVQCVHVETVKGCLSMYHSC